MNASRGAPFVAGLLAVAGALNGCALGTVAGGGGVAGSPIGPDTSGVLRPFNDQPLAESFTYGRTRAGNFHYRYFDRTTGAACVLEGVRGDVFVEYPTREQVRSTSTFAQAPQTFAQPVALELQRGGADLPMSIAAAPLHALMPGGAADQGAASGLDVVLKVAGGVVRQVADLVLNPILGMQRAAAVAAPEVRVVTTYVRDGDLRCVLVMHSAQVADTSGAPSVGAERPPTPLPGPASVPVLVPAPTPSPVRLEKKPGR